MGTEVERIREKIASFKKRYYLNIAIRGVLVSLSILVFYFLAASLLEYFLWLNPGVRLLIFFAFFITACSCIYLFLKDPLLWWLTKRGMNDEQSAVLIGRLLPPVKDRLLNLIQLSNFANEQSSLAQASVFQKSKEIEPLAFNHAIDLNQNKRYLKYLALPLAVIVLLLFINQQIITQSTERIVHFNRQYSPQAPFKFLIDKNQLTAFYLEDYTLVLKLDGHSIPDNAYIITPSQRLKLVQQQSGEFTYTFEKIQKGFNFQVEAAGFFSEPFSLNVVNRPELVDLKIELQYPDYLQIKNEHLQNTGNLEVPEGTTAKWLFSTAHTQTAAILFSSEKNQTTIQSFDNQPFMFSRRLMNTDDYEILLGNEKSQNKDKIAYHVEVKKDEFPRIELTPLTDSVLYKRILLGGNISDDYGVTELALYFRIRDEKKRELSVNKALIPITRNQTQSSFFFNWSLDSLKLNPGQQVEYYLQVWDNDGVNGRKSTKSGSYVFFIPSEDNLQTEIKYAQSKTQEKLDQNKNKATKLQEQIEQANQRLKGKQNLDWRDKKMLEDIIQQRQNLDQTIQQMQKQNEMLDEKKIAFTEQSERIREKAKEIQKLMDALLDEETRKLFEELQKLLKENQDITQIQKILNKLQQNSSNLEKELERTLELFKQLQYDFTLDQTIQDLQQQVEKQHELLEKTKTQENQKKEKTNSSQELAKEQNELKDAFKHSTEKIEELKKLGDELKLNDEFPSDEMLDDIQQKQEESQQMLEQNNPSKAKPAQQKALNEMQEIQQQMEGMQNSLAMEMDMQNLDALRQIIHGLVRLSFDQETLMRDFNELQQSDPRFNTIAQRQLKLKDDSKILEDSLLELSKKDAFMGSFITREIGELNIHLDKAVELNKERRKPQAISEMQLTMTSINNLALMLDDHFEMMMQMMGSSKPSMKGSKQKGQKPSLSQLQQQLNQRIQDLKGSGKSGKQLSEELAEMAAEQERIRRALQEMENSMKKDGKTPGGDTQSKMEQSEMDLVNKQLTEQLIKRQQDILTRLLDTEKSMREQDMDEERKGETAKDYEKEIPKAYEEYLRLKEKEVELLKTVPPKLYPYYKKEVNDYFKRIQ